MGNGADLKRRWRAPVLIGAWVLAGLAAGLPVRAVAQQETQLDLAERLADQGEVGQARQALARWESEHGESAPSDERARAWYLGARLANDGPAAELLYLRVIIEGSSTRYADNALLRLAQYKYAQKDYAGVVEYLGRLRRDYPTSEHGPEALLWIARSERALGDAERACAAADQGLLEVAPTDVELEVALREERSGCRETTRTYTVQVAAFKDEMAAQNIARELLTTGYDAWVLNATPDDPIYRVRVGRGLVESEAEALLERLTRVGYSPFLVSQTRSDGRP